MSDGREIENEIIQFTNEIELRSTKLNCKWTSMGTESQLQYARKVGVKT